MGDMKTPDFDDLLAAFDIPDATGLDAKESHEETEGQLKHTGMCLDDGLLAHHAATTADIPVVSVIVKNTSRQESLEGFGDGTHSVPVPPLQNGYRGLETSVDSSELPSSGFSKSFASTLNGDTSGELLAKAPIQHKPEATPLFSQSFSQFSPISSPESEDTQSSRVDSCQKQERPYFPDPSVLVETTLSDEQKTTSLSMFDGCPEESDTRENTLSNIADSTKTEHTLTEEPSGSYNGDKNVSHDGVLPPPNDPKQTQTDCDTAATSDMPAAHSYVKRQTSSCLEALVALNTGKDHSEQTNLKESSVVHCDSIKASPKVPTSPRSPRSPLEATKQLAKVSDSPVSIYSDCSGKASPHAVASGSPPAIPRVRIKTIKTTSGHIKRTVTSVVPDSEADEDQSAYESSPSQSMISEDSFCNMSPCQSQNVASDITVGMPVKGAPVSTLPSNVLHDKSEGHPKKPSLKQSPSIFHSASGPVEQGQKPKRIPPAPTGHATNTNFLPKAMHLANLNLVPHSVAASVATRSAGHQQSQHALASSTVCSTVPLVHQVKTPSPHPSTALPNTAAGTLNRLLNNANPVPTYVPNLNPPPESNISLPPRGYCCLECGDSFGVERSLMHHYGRRSVHIEVACTHCAKTLVFFNKCALLAHAREHKMKGTVMQCTQLFMKPIAEEQMFVPLSTGSLANADVRVLPSPSPKSQPVMPLYPDNVIRHRLRCLECNKQLSDYRALAGHYQRLSEDLEGLICKVCSMLSPNKCSFKAHQRLHAHKSPYCCPECGALSRSADIQKHVKENCLHYTRKAWYKCLHCDVVFKTVHGQKNHIEEKHCDVFYKCSICPVAFKSSDSCDTHIQNKHDTSSKTSPQLIFKCSCETVFKKKQLLFQHFHQSASKRATCVFKCPECSSVFPQKQVLMQHFKSVHGGIFKGEAEKNGNNQTDGTTRNQETVSTAVRQPGIPSSTATKRTDTSRKRAEDSKPHVKPAGWTCGECLQTFPERDPYVSHMKSDHGRSMKRYPCRQCERSFNSSTSLRRHIRNDHDIEQKTYSCWYCTDTKSVFNTGVMLKNHISLMHGIKNPDLSLMPKTPIPESNVSREGRGTKRPARPTDTQSERQDPAVSQGGAPSAKRPKASLFRCSKCGFATEHSTQFREHIPQHKTDENTPQCLHCGLCFTSPTSLNRHLYIVHKVKESEEDARQPLSSVEEPGIGGEVQHTPSSSSSSSSEAEVNASLQRCSGDAYQAEEKSSVAHCDRGTLDCHLKPSSKAQTQEVCLQ